MVRGEVISPAPCLSLTGLGPEVCSLDFGLRFLTSEARWNCSRQGDTWVKVQCAKAWRASSAQTAAGSGREVVHGPPGAVHVHEGDGFIASGPAAGLADRPGPGGRPQGPGAQ